MRKLNSVLNLGPEAGFECRLEPCDRDQVGPALAGDDGRDGGVVQVGGPGHFPQASSADGASKADGELVGVVGFGGPFDLPVGPVAFDEIRAGWAPKSGLTCHTTTLDEQIPGFLSFASGMVFPSTGPTVRAVWGRAASGDRP